MSKDKNIFLNIDRSIFNFIDQLKNDNTFNFISDLRSKLTEDEEKIVSQIIILLLVIIPYLFVTFFLLSNYAQKKKIENKKEALVALSKMIDTKSNYSQVTNQLLATNSFLSNEEMESKLIDLKSKLSIKNEKVNLKDFNIISNSNQTVKMTATIMFNNFGNSEFSNFFRELMEVERFKIKKAQFTKDSNSKLLSGDVEIYHIGRSYQ